MADGGWSNVEELAILNHFFANGASPAKTSTFLALSTTQPTDAGTNITEPTYTGYGRQEITNVQWENAAGDDPSGLQNTQVIQFPLCNENVGELVTYWALMTLVSGGALVFSGSIIVPSGGLTLNAGIQPQFDAGALRVQLGSVAV